MESAFLLSLILIPLVSAFGSLLFSGNSLKSFVAFSGFVGLIISVFVLIQLNSSSDSSAFQYSISYLPSLGQSLSLGLNGISATLVFLSALLSFVVLFGVIGNDKSVSKGMVFNVLLLESFLALRSMRPQLPRASRALSADLPSLKKRRQNRCGTRLSRICRRDGCRGWTRLPRSACRGPMAER